MLLRVRKRQRMVGCRVSAFAPGEVEPDDPALVRAAQDGDRDALDALIAEVRSETDQYRELYTSLIRSASDEAATIRL